MSLSVVRREAVELLCAAQADGRISDRLFEERLAAVQGASSDAGVLAIVADLREETPGHGVDRYEPEPAMVPFSQQLRVSSVLTSTRREGNWVVPYQLEVHLAEQAEDSLVMIVPKGTTVQNEVDAILGSNEHKKKGKSFVPPNGLTLRVTGNVLLGSVEIREM